MQRGSSGPTAAETSVSAAAHTGLSLGTYRLLGVLGEGPTGVVHRAVRETSAAGQAARQVVIKILHAELCQGEEAVAALRGQLSRLSRAGEPRAAALLDDGVAPDGRLYLVSERVEGTELSAAVRGPRGVASPALSAMLVARACRAVESAHAVGVLHGGIKPRNILVLPGGEVRVTDFAVWGCLAAGSSQVVFGDPRYLAPEQLDGHCDARSDVYALGAVLCELLTGAPPAAGEALFANGRLAVDGALREIVARAVELHPSRRYSSVSQLRAALESWVRPTALAGSVLVRASLDARLSRSVSVAETTDGDVLPGGGQPAGGDGPAGEAPLLAAAPSTGAGSNGHTDSIEASLEDFIAQAARSYGEPKDGWSLNTDEVELVDSDEGKDKPAAAAPVAPPSGPIRPPPPRAATVPPVAARHAVAPPSAVDPITAPTALPVEPPGSVPSFSMDPSVPVTVSSAAATAVTALPSFDEVAPVDDLAAERDAAVLLASPSQTVATRAAMPAPVAPPRSTDSTRVTALPAHRTSTAPVAPAPVASAPAARIGVAPPTAVVAALPAPAAARASGGLPAAVTITGSFVIGAAFVVLLLKVVGVQFSPPPAVVPPAPVASPAAAPSPAPLVPVVTQLPSTASAPTTAAQPPANPVVTPIAAPAPTEPAPLAAPVAAEAPKVAHRSSRASSSSSTSSSAAQKPARTAAPRPAARPAPAPAPAPKPAPPASTPRSNKKGDAWVDPFGG